MKLYYIHDPMCSWCWGFRPTWLKVKDQLDNNIRIQSVLGGLAADSDRAMPESMRTHLRQTWRHIQQEIPGTVFNFDFWKKNIPRRSTWPSCRAVIAARLQDAGAADQITLAIQEAYYLKARNPSDTAVLVDAARSVGLDIDRFTADLFPQSTQQQLDEEIALGRKLGASGFPGLVLEINRTFTLLKLDYNNPATILEQIDSRFSK